ncbi:hypothetical protein [Cryptosporangium sp. NPDC051539]|uniref:hypothetical protein n=1 Tax=Cryptosporangium sp. NPDC051539 TaxID=3363962 RepID=UPI00379EC828
MNRRNRAWALPIAVGALLCSAACGADEREDTPAPKPSPSLPTATPGTVEEVAARVGCRPKIQIEATELRQGVCTTSVGYFGVTTFPTDELKSVWLDAASGRPGWYVVGPRWAVSIAERRAAETLRKTLGGALVDGWKIAEREGPPAPSAS